MYHAGERLLMQGKNQLLARGFVGIHVGLFAGNGEATFLENPDRCCVVLCDMRNDRTLGDLIQEL